MAVGTLRGCVPLSDFAAGKRAVGVCDRCGFHYPLKKLKKLFVNSVQVNTKVCPECWEPDHPQNQLGRYPVRDPQAIRDPRPDFNEYEQSRANIVPVRSLIGHGWVGTVTVTIA